MDTDNTSKYNGLKFSLFIFECVMAFAYLAVSIVLLFTPLLKSNVGGELRIGLGVMLGLYGLFRVYRAYKKMTQKDE